MKKLVMISVGLVVLAFVGCSINDDTTITKSDAEETKITLVATEDYSTVSSEIGEAVENINALGDVDVDKDLFNVELTIPAEFFGDDFNQEKLDETVEEKGYESGIINEDGSVTYVMTKAQHEELMETMTDSLDESLQETIDSGDYPNIISISHNSDFTDFTVEYDGDSLGMDGIISIQFYMTGAIFGYFSGETPENIHVEYVNYETGEIIEESNSQDMNTESNN